MPLPRIGDSRTTERPTRTRTVFVGRGLLRLEIKNCRENLPPQPNCEGKKKKKIKKWCDLLIEVKEFLYRINPVEDFPIS